MGRLKRKERYMYILNRWFRLLDSRNKHNMGKQLSSNLKNKKTVLKRLLSKTQHTHFFFLLDDNCFTMLCCLCHTSTSISPRSMCVPPSWSPLLSPTPSHTFRLSQSTGLNPFPRSVHSSPVTPFHYCQLCVWKYGTFSF